MVYQREAGRVLVLWTNAITSVGGFTPGENMKRASTCVLRPGAAWFRELTEAMMGEPPLPSSHWSDTADAADDGLSSTNSCRDAGVCTSVSTSKGVARSVPATGMEASAELTEAYCEISPTSSSSSIEGRTPSPLPAAAPAISNPLALLLKLPCRAPLMFGSGVSLRLELSSRASSGAARSVAADGKLSPLPPPPDIYRCQLTPPEQAAGEQAD